MGRFDFGNVTLGCANFSRRICRFSEQRLPVQPLSGLARRPAIRIAFWIVLALTCGAWAQGAAYQNALSDWENHHSPSAQTWAFSLQKLGMTNLSDPTRLAKVTRSLPTLDVGPDGPTIWTVQTGDAIWVALLDPPLRVFEFGTGVSHSSALKGSMPALGASHWVPQGTGWRGYEQTVTSAEAAIEQIKKQNRRPINAIARDPRELVY